MQCLTDGCALRQKHILFNIQAGPHAIHSLRGGITLPLLRSFTPFKSHHQRRPNSRVTYPGPPTIVVAIYSSCCSQYFPAAHVGRKDRNGARMCALTGLDKIWNHPGMQPPLTLHVVEEERQGAVSPPTFTLLARVELLEQQMCQLAALHDMQMSPSADHISAAGSSEPSTPSSAERRRKPVIEVIGDTVAKGTVLERVANLEHLQSSIFRELSLNGKLPGKATRSLFSSASSSPGLKKPKASAEENGSGRSADLPRQEASIGGNGNVTDHGKLPPERQFVDSDQAEESALFQSLGVATQQEQRETAGSDTTTMTTPTPSTEQKAESPVAIEGTTNSMHEAAKSPHPRAQEEEEDEEENLEQGYKRLDTTKGGKQSRDKPWKRFQNYIKKKVDSMSSSNPQKFQRQL